MNISERVKIFKRSAARNGLHASSWLINRLPYGMVRWITHIFIVIGFWCTVKQNRIARESLRVAFGAEKDAQQIDAIVKACFENFGRGMIELIYFMAHPAMIKEKVVIQGKEHLDTALEAGNGVIAVSAHFGNFPLMLLRFVQEGYKTNAIIRSTRDKEIEGYFLEQRSRLGLNTIYSHPRKTCVDSSIRALRSNELVFIPLDQNFGSSGGVFVDFFGQKAATAPGPVIFAKRTKAPIIPVFIIRENDDQMKIIIDPPMPLEERDDDQEMISVNIAKITRIIEGYIRKYPHEWGWMHRRWKSKPQNVV